MIKKGMPTKVLLHSYLILFMLFILGPIFLLVSNGLKPKLKSMTSPFSLPQSLTFDSTKQAWITADYWRGYLNSFLVGAFTIAIVVVIASLAAYALTKMEFKGKGALMAMLLIVISIPLGVYLVPIFFLYIHLKLMDTLGGIIIIYSGIFLPVSIFIFRSYFLNIPRELSESAFVDGLNHFQVYWRIIMAISKPVISTVATIVGLWTWNEFFFANALLQSDEIRTVATRYLAFVGNFDTDWNLISAAGIIAVFPILIAYLLFQDKFIAGITQGSIKG